MNIKQISFMIRRQIGARACASRKLCYWTVCYWTLKLRAFQFSEQ